uniref:Retrotransposon Copia-like N-terminal domain-containing protein n=1 Tax=Chenopodium quinoa TaxID=63459 RepID=A0A803MDR9_CHEQI
MSKISLADMQNPLYLHPSDGHNSVSVDKLTGAANYREWRRSMEIVLASKRKLGFVTGLVKKDAEDEVKADQWDTCNNMVIAWLMSCMSDSIKRSVLFLNTARDVWKNLEIRFSQTNGARKYKLCRDVYDLKQNGRSLSDYYTEMSSLWEEIEGLNLLPPITEMNSEVNVFISALNQQKDEHNLFQFLNGLDEDYTALRSQIFMQSPLPTVELACAQLQQEESQRGNKVGCSVCGNKSHTAEQCWKVIGYPSWHPQYKKQQKQKGKEAQQLEQLIKLVPSSSKTGKTSYDTKEEIESGFAGMITCNNASSSMNEWILDSGASDHMISNDKLLDESIHVKGNTKINLPNGGTAKITHIGNVLLKNGLHFKNVMCVPEFKHNLLSIHKLPWTFYLMNDDLDLANKKKNAEVKRNNSSKTLKTERRTGDSVKRKFVECNVASVDQCTLWHNRLGHAPFEKLVKIGCVSGKCKNNSVCFICPMARFTKLPYPPRGVPCVFLGYPQDTKGYKVMNLLNMQCFVSRDVKFYEHIFPFNKVNSTGSYNTPLPISVHELSHDGGRESGQLAPDMDQISVDDEETGNDPVVNHETEDPDPQQCEEIITETIPDTPDEPAYTSESNHDAQQTAPETHLRRSTRPHRSPKWLMGYDRRVGVKRSKTQRGETEVNAAQW